MYIKKIYRPSRFIREKDLRFSIVTLMKLQEKKIMEWYGSRNRNSNLRWLYIVLKNYAQRKCFLYILTKMMYNETM